MKKWIAAAIGILIVLVVFLSNGFSDQGIISRIIGQKFRGELKTVKIKREDFAFKSINALSSLLPESFQSRKCQYQALGLSFACRPNWKIVEKNNQLKLIVTSDESVVVTIDKIPELLYLNQINSDALQASGRYHGRFSVEEVYFSGNKAFKVKAFSGTDPQLRLTDYYLLHDEDLYRISFVVQPKDRWEEYKFLIRDLSKGFGFY